MIKFLCMFFRTFTQISTQWPDTDGMREELDDLQVDIFADVMGLIVVDVWTIVGGLSSFYTIHCYKFWKLWTSQYFQVMSFVTQKNYFIIMLWIYYKIKVVSGHPLVVSILNHFILSRWKRYQFL